VARFCACCGLPLTAGIDGTRRPGLIAHPTPLPPPENAGWQRVADAADLYFRLESAWGGQRVLDTENIGLLIFNAGYPLQEIVVNVTPAADAGAEPFAADYQIPALPRGQSTSVEIPSWEMRSAMEEVQVRLVSAEFAAED
jgi:hypothetical protein